MQFVSANRNRAVLLVATLMIVCTSCGVLPPGDGDAKNRLRKAQGVDRGPADLVAGQELINLVWRPEVSEVQQGEGVELGLYAAVEGDSDEAFSRAQVILNWDPAVLTLLGAVNNGPYPWIFADFPNDSGLDGLNDTFDDGDALYLMIANFDEFPEASQEGLLMTTFQFEAVGMSDGTVVSIPETAGDLTVTEILDDEDRSVDITGELGTATVVVTESGASVRVPEEFEVVRGEIVSGGLEDLFDSDDSALVLWPTPFTGASDEPPVWVIVRATSTMESPSTLMFTMEAQTGTPFVTQSVELFNYVAQEFQEVDTRVASFDEDSVVEIVLDSDPSQFIDPESLEMQAQLTWEPGPLVLMFPWEVRIDQTIWTVIP